MPGAFRAAATGEAQPGRDQRALQVALKPRPERVPLRSRLRALFLGQLRTRERRLLRRQERGPLRVQERVLVREEERRLLRAEDWGQVRVLLRPEEPRLEQGLFTGEERGQERPPHLGPQRRLLRVEERGPHRGPQLPPRPPPLNYPSCTKSQTADNTGLMTHGRHSLICRFVDRASKGNFA